MKTTTSTLQLFSHSLWVNKEERWRKEDWRKEGGANSPSSSFSSSELFLIPPEVMRAKAPRLPVIINICLPFSSSSSLEFKNGGREEEEEEEEEGGSLGWMEMFLSQNKQVESLIKHTFAI